MNPKGVSFSHRPARGLWAKRRDTFSPKTGKSLAPHFVLEPRTDVSGCSGIGKQIEPVFGSTLRAVGDCA